MIPYHGSFLRDIFPNTFNIKFLKKYRVYNIINKLRPRNSMPAITYLRITRHVVVPTCQ